MAEHNSKNENDDMLEIKVEPAVQSYTEVEHGYAEFENSNLIPSTADVGALNLWTSKATSCLITQYKKYRSMVGQTTRMKSLREMFEMVSLEMQKYGFYFSAQKCENKWRVLERKYKNLVYREKLKKPGRMRHYGHWEHKIALDEIFNERKRKMYLDDNDYSPPGASNKFTLILPKPGGDSCNNTVEANQSQPVEDPLAGATVNSQSAKESDESEDLRTCLTVMFEKFLARMDKNFITQQQNKERRHKEKMAIRQSELELQKKLFKLKEQKMALKKSQLLAAAQHVHLNME
ncbi:uncharacterized protein LOC124178728 [Neodiprion fabricii]|uniref:uncharacterized protein LOC124178728 n=1 Tax=Neodiprion fabricii TaxID=2872261 RepID=UPI001ED8E09F|nr:uncharacterized protein LOC124178728 [Neodiprion fabricii]